ncbi:hypothetical protein [Chlamydia avium]|uniref:Uncharacterized protein n=1 Tax=Chlamydia avium 10DC88 TaxID=1229831 RepID=W8K1R6_9CHLA|nr:hypothetical protein [Chlamydia avium]AHK63767.1 Uncharacterized protein M832_09200 [Chlamydia avium 10DC88]
MQRFLSVIRLHLTSWLSNFFFLHQYNIYSRFTLLLLCRWKDADIKEWQSACNLLLEVCNKMGTELSSRTSKLLDAGPVLGEEQKIAEWKQKCLVLEQDFLSREETQTLEIEKLKSENIWLQNRLAEKLQQTRHQNDVIEGLKRDLIESVQQTEISEGRRLCYEHKIKMLEEQIDRLAMSQTRENMFETQAETSFKQQKMADTHFTLSFWKNQVNKEILCSKDVDKFHLDLQCYGQSRQKTQKIIQVQE